MMMSGTGGNPETGETPRAKKSSSPVDRLEDNAPPLETDPVTPRLGDEPGEEALEEEDDPLVIDESGTTEKNQPGPSTPSETLPGSNLSPSQSNNPVRMEDVDNGEHEDAHVFLYDIGLRIMK